MLRSRLAVMGLGFITMLMLVFIVQGHMVIGDETASATSSVEVMLSAAHTTASWNSSDPAAVEYDLPLLYLRRQRQAATDAERTLAIEIAGLAPGSEVHMVALSQHVNVATGARHQETQHVILPNRPCTITDPGAVEWTFDAASMPSDFYTLQLLDPAGQILWTNPHPSRPDFVALDTWDVGVGTDATNGAPYSVRITYANLFPFALGQQDLGNRLAPDHVTDFVEGQFAPTIIETWRTQVLEWGFGAPLHPEWDVDRVVEVIVTDHSHALFGATGTCSRPLLVDGSPNPQRRIWWLSYMDNFLAYDNLDDAYRATFAHEFFHLMQWNVRLQTARPQIHWLNLVIEAQAIAAASVQYPEIELVKGRIGAGQKAYAQASQRFLSGRLNTSYKALEGDSTHRYDAALYWRFLYEQYGSMGVFRAALKEMAVQLDSNMVGSMDRVMDAAFARQPGPFSTYEVSLDAFARANYALRLENGRCAAQDFAGCGGRYYDPTGVYMDPPLEQILDYGGSPVVYDGAISSSYGIDFVDVRLDPTLREQALTVVLQGDGTATRFGLQVWRLGPGATKPRSVNAEPEVLPQTADGSCVYVIPQVDTTAYDRLALIITRLDSDEVLDPEGRYRITLASTAEPTGGSGE